MLELNMIPAMSMADIRHAISDASGDNPRFALVCHRSDWCIFVIEANRVRGIELEVNFWAHDHTEGATLFHSGGDDDEFMCYTTDVRAIFDDEATALEVSQKLAAATQKLEEAMKGPFVTFQMDMMVALA